MYWFTMNPIHERMLDICNLCGSGATYPKHVFLKKKNNLIILYDPYVQTISNSSENLH